MSCRGGTYPFFLYFLFPLFITWCLCVPFFFFFFFLIRYFIIWSLPFVSGAFFFNSLYMLIFNMLFETCLGFFPLFLLRGMIYLADFFYFFFLRDLKKIFWASWVDVLIQFKYLLTLFVGRGESFFSFQIITILEMYCFSLFHFRISKMHGQRVFTEKYFF